MIKLKNALNRFNFRFDQAKKKKKRFDQAEERISKLENIM